MSDTPSRSAAPPDVVSDTHSGAVEGTGGHPAPAPNAERPTTRVHVLPGIEVLPRLGDYFVVRKIGEGAMGSVYLAEDTRLGRKLAIKTMRPELAANQADRDRFVREARAAAAVEHDNIVPVWQVGEAADGTPFIAMPFLQGESLDARIRREPIAPPSLLVKVAAEVAEGLAAAHAAGLIHRDIKPANIWLEGDLGSPDPAKRVRRAKLLDFGLARSVDQSDMQLTATGAVMGTPAYMSPEQARGEHVDARADLFSLGATLYRMATGQFPFEGSTPIAVMIALTTDTPRPVRELAPDLPLSLAELIDRLMCKDVCARPQSAAEVSVLVRALGAGTPSSPFGDTPSTESISKLFPQLATAEEYSEPAAPRVRNWWPRVLAVSCLLALVPLGLWATGAFADKKQPPEVAEINKPSGSEGSTVAPPKAEIPKVENKVEPKQVEPTTIESPRIEAQVAPPPRAVPEMIKPVVAPKLDADRAAALYALSVGGTVRVGEQQQPITTAAELPDEPFRLVAAAFGEKIPVSDAELTTFATCRHLNRLDLSDTKVSDAGVAHLKGCRSLTHLSLKGTQITSAALEHLRECDRLEELNVGSTKVDDAGLGHIKRFAKLRRLDLLQANVTAGAVTDLAEALPDCDIVWDGGITRPASDPDWKAALWVLNAGGAVRVNAVAAEVKSVTALPKRPFKLTAISLTKPVKDADLAVVAGCAELAGARLAGTGITDAGLAHFKGCNGLTDLDLTGTKATDESAAVIKRFTKLASLSLGAAAISEKGLKEIAEALPGCNIQWIDRAAAEYVLSVGGTVRVSSTDRDVRTVADLPRAPYRLRVVDLNENKRATGADLTAFRGCPDLRSLRLSKVRVSDTNLAAFKDCKSLTELDLRDTPVGDAGLGHFDGCKHLTILRLSGTKVSDTGLAVFKGCKGLTELDLRGTKVSDTSVAHFGGNKALLHLDLSVTRVGDAGMAAFTDCKSLVSLQLGWTQVSDAGLAYFKGCKNLEQLQLGSLEVSEAGLVHFKDCKKLKVLYLSDTRVTDGALAHFKGCKGLENLHLASTRVTDAGLAHFKDCKEFRFVALDRTKVGDAGLAHLAGCKNLTHLWLSTTEVTDAGLAHVKQSAALAHLHLERTKVTAKGIADLQKVLPKCQIKWDDTAKPEKK